MTQPPVRVEWAHPPTEWMRPAALAFESSLYQSHGNALPIRANDTLVIHITTFHESCRPENCTGDPLQESGPMLIEMVTDPMSYIVSKKGAISTSAGRFFLKKKWIGKMQALSLFLMVIQVAFVNSSTYQEGKHGRINYYPITDMLGQSFCMLTFIFFTAHIISKDLMKICVWYFDWLVICVMAAVAETTFMWEFFGNHRNPGELGVAYCFVKVFSSLTRILAHSMCALMDAWVISIRMKAVILFLYDLSVAAVYVHYRWRYQWSHLTICPLYNNCQAIQDTFVYAMGNIVFFSAKLTIPYIMGYPYALLRCYYVSRPKDPVTSADLYGWPLDMFLPRQSIAQRSSEWLAHGSYVGTRSFGTRSFGTRSSQLFDEARTSCLRASTDCSQAKESCCQMEEIAEELQMPPPHSTQIVFANSLDPRN